MPAAVHHGWPGFVSITGPPRTCVRPAPSSSISSWPQVWLCQLERLPFGKRRRVVRTFVASTDAGVPPMKLLVWPTTQMGAATASRIVRSFTRVIDISRSAEAVVLPGYRYGDVVVGEHGAVACHGAEHVGARLLEGGLRDPLVVGRRLGDVVRRGPRRVRVRPRVGPRLHLF